ncbi:hypothetical protein V6N11_011162 [Hibiscus sabdariffa]|uniref:Secreted protein n=1 Tax=Hibiscus sabdariffa TaxID=183260 RepID=A0ABR2S7D9_9ROSI
MACFIASNLFTLAVFISTSDSESTSMQNSHASPTEAREQGLKSRRDDYLWAVVAAAWVAGRVSPTMTTVTSAGEKSTTSTAVGGL